MKLDHVGIAVRSIDEALGFYTGALRIECAGRETVEEQGVHVARLPVGESRIELLEPMSEDSAVGRFIAKRGEGIHHICLEVEDIEAMLAELRASQIRLIDEFPRWGAEGRKIAFLHPSSARGVLIELVEKPKKPGVRSQKTELNHLASVF